MDRENIKKEIGKKIRELREQRGLSQEELAIKCGYASKHAISKIETGISDVAPTKMIKIASALNVDPQDIMFTDAIDKIFTDDEVMFINAYRNASQAARLAAYSMLLNPRKE